MKIYLDTNIVHGWFRRVMESRRRGRGFEEPAILRFIFQVPGNEYFVSNLTRVEILRYLAADWGVTRQEATGDWDRFLVTYGPTHLRVEWMDIDELGELVLSVRTKKKTLVNLLHLQVAKKEGLWFLTGEGRLAESYRGYYTQVLTYEGFRQRFR